ncbi:hypothetical protein NMG60_11003484 [Bertholletia excelsa]
MLTRLISRFSHIRVVALVSSSNHFSHHKPINRRGSILLAPSANSNFSFFVSRYFSSNENQNGEINKKDRDGEPTSTTDYWKLSVEDDRTVDSIFDEDAGTLEGISGDDLKPDDGSWMSDTVDRVNAEDKIFGGVDKGIGESDIGENVGDSWVTAEGDKPWTLLEEEKGDDMFDIGEEASEKRVGDGEEMSNTQKTEEDKRLEEEKRMLCAVLKGPNRAFGDLIAASGITEEMLDSLFALKDLDGIQGLPPLREIEDLRYQKNISKSKRAEIERQKQEDVAKARVRDVDEKGRAYGTGKRKCSVARVWIQPGNGKFMVNDKEFDVYFPMLDHRAALLRPFSETKTLGCWDVKCTVKGGGVSGQVGAIRLGISKALQNWEPDLRPPLKAAGFLTRDPRVVERKKPGKAKARKSFQWVKR